MALFIVIATLATVATTGSSWRSLHTQAGTGVTASGTGNLNLKLGPGRGPWTGSAGDQVRA